MRTFHFFLSVIVLILIGCAVENVPPYWSKTVVGCNESENERLAKGILDVTGDSGLVVGAELGGYLPDGTPELVSWPIYAAGVDFSAPKPPLPVALVVRTPGRVNVQTFVVGDYSVEEIERLSGAISVHIERFLPSCKDGLGRSY